MNTKAQSEKSGARDENGRARTANPLDIIAHEHMWQEKLCDALERIADDLPDNVDRTLVSAILPMLRDDLAVHFRDEDEGLFPLLQKRSLPDDNFDQILSVLMLEHAADEGFADEIVDHLEDLSRRVPPENPDMLGYMLRGFFETQRRHVAWENAVVMPLAYSRLTEEDLRELSRVMLDNRKQKRLRTVRSEYSLFAFQTRSD